MFIHAAGNRRTERTADKNAGHVQRVQAAAAVGIEGVDGALAEDHIHLHAEVQNHTGDCQADHAVERVYQRREETQRAKQHRQQRGAVGMAGIGQATGHGRGDGAKGTDQGKQCDLALAQAVVTRQFQWYGSPEQAEGGEHATLVERPLAQQRLLTQQGAQGAQQLAVAGTVIGLALGDCQHQHHADKRHQCGGRHEHRTPAEVVGHHARHRPCQQDAQQQAAHDAADHPAPGFGRRQVCGQRNQDLHRDGTETDQQRHQQEQVRLFDKRRTQQAGDRHDGGGDHQLAVFQQVAQRHQEKQAQGIADLREGHDQAGHCRRQANVWGNQLDDRLRVVDVGDDGAAAKREQHDHAPGHGACSVRGCVHGVLIKAKDDGVRE